MIIFFQDIIIYMPPKKQKKQALQTKEEASKGDEKLQTKKAAQKFSCICGKVYGSLAAVHTHINNKHPDQKKKYKSQIINPKKNGQPVSTSIRMKDISYDEVQAQLMCHADINLKNIHDYFKQIQKNAKEDILIDMNQDLSDDSDIDIDDLLSPRESQQKVEKVQSKRQIEINNKIREMKGELGLYDMEKYINGAEQLQNIKIDKFKLNIIRQLSKFFIIEFSAKVELSLQIIHVLHKHHGGDSELCDLLKIALDRLWHSYPKIKKILEVYYDQWFEIKCNLKEWKRRQEKRQISQQQV